jgi:hypothetical protein
MTNKNEVLGALNTSLDSNLNLQATSGTANYVVGATSLLNTGVSNTLSGWGWWTNEYYPYIIKESYPVYMQERAKDTGKQAFEIIKALQDRKLIKLDKVSDFVTAMDLLIKIL